MGISKPSKKEGGGEGGKTEHLQQVGEERAFLLVLLKREQEHTMFDDPRPGFAKMVKNWQNLQKNSK